MKTIPLTQGKVALVDDEDFERLNQFKWFALKNKNIWHAARMAPGIGGKQKIVWMHREVLGVSKPIDHKNTDGLDNQKDNLRPASNQQNQQNRNKWVRAGSLFKGVYWDKQYGKWRSQIQANGKKKSLGRFESEEAAARIYDEAAREYFGEFARPNFP